MNVELKTKSFAFGTLFLFFVIAGFLYGYSVGRYVWNINRVSEQVLCDVDMCRQAWKSTDPELWDAYVCDEKRKEKR